MKFINRIPFCVSLFAVVFLSCAVMAQDVTKKDAQNNETKKKTTSSPPFKWVNPLPDDHHPALKHATFRSPTMKVDVGYCVLLPPSYKEADSIKRYPVVYYLHGGRPGSETKSIRLADAIYDAMQGDDAVEEAIYVFVNGGPVSHYNMPDQPEAQGADVFIKELIPHIDATYRTIANRNARGIEGFSQGGRGTMRLSLRYPELFCSAAAGGGGYETERKISESHGYENDDLKFAEGDNAWDLAHQYTKGDSPKVRWMIYVGTKCFNYENNLRYMEYLDLLGIPHEKLIVSDVDHSATRIYEKEAKRIMNFHADNFK